MEDLHIKVYRNEAKTSRRYTFFNVEFCVFSNFFAVSFSWICKEKQANAVLIWQRFQIRFIASCMAVLRAWTFVYSTLFSSAPLPALHRQHRRFLWHSCALLSDSDYCRFFRVRRCIPEVRNSQCHRQNRTRFGGAGKQICFSCRTL